MSGAAGVESGQPPNIVEGLNIRVKGIRDMALWDSTNQKIVRWPPRLSSAYPGWEELDCGCCNGLVWGTEQPTECTKCGGRGTIFRHIKSGALAQYPGGPFVGHERQIVEHHQSERARPKTEVPGAVLKRGQCARIT